VNVRALFPLWSILVIFGLAIATVSLRLSIVQMSYEVDQLQKMASNAFLNLEKSELKLGQLRSPARLEHLARKKFSLGPPLSHQVIPMKEEQKIRDDKNGQDL
jgi:hypothetical protein